ncbi:pyridoxal-dependent decarboxylase [Granulicella sibirica]|nr:pyridoxal-dependent decarboxylase [Granulicella sibirica]
MHLSEATGSTSLDPADWQAFRTQAHSMLDDMLGHIETIRERPVWQQTPDDIRATFNTPLPTEGTSLETIQHEFMTSIVPYTAANIHPGFMGWVQGGGSPAGFLAEILAAGLNANVGGRNQVPLDVERLVTGWMRDLFGFPASASGICLTGTSMANFVAVVIARYARLGANVRRTGLNTDQPRVTAYASRAVHGSLARALDMAGLGSESLRSIAIDAHGRIDLLDLQRRIAEDRAAGLSPFLVAGTAGTVDTGAIDDLDALANICAQEALWFHVDGALGALAMLSPTLAPRLRGIERADSLAFDFHKWGQVPYEAGFLLVRDGDLHRQAFESPCAYLSREEQGLAAGSLWPCDLGPELSRSFRGLKVWMTFKTYGTRKLASVIEHTCDLAQYLAQRIAEIPELELLAPVELNIVCLRYRFQADNDLSNRLNRALVVRLQLAGAVAPSTTTLNGKVAIRAAIVNHRTTHKEIDTLIEETLALGRELQPITPAARERFLLNQRLQSLDQQLSTKNLPEHDEVELLVERAMLLTQTGRTLEARSDHLRVLALNPKHKTNLLELGRLLVAAGQRNAARVVYTEAVKHYPDDLPSRVNLGSALLQTGEAAAAREQYEYVLSIDPNLPQAHGGMYYALGLLGEHAEAEVHRRKGFSQKNLFETPYRGKDDPISLILLVSSSGGNTPVEKLLDDQIFRTHVLVADFYDPTQPLPPHDLIFNGIGDVDTSTEALRAAESLVRGDSRVLNQPTAVLATSRRDNARRLATLEGVRTARTEIYPHSLLAGGEALAALERDGFRFPLLLRTPGFHMGQHFIKVDSPEHLHDQVTELPGAGREGSELLVIESLDARGHDGCSRKYRVMMIDGELYPLHLAISPNWKIHYFSADMKDRPDHREEEARFLTNMEETLGKRAMTGLHGVRDALGLDYCGIDFGLDPEGNVLLFEANANMVVEQPDEDPRWDYRRTAVARIHAAVRQMLTRIPVAV